MFKIPYKIKRICTKILRIILIFSVIASLISFSCFASNGSGDTFKSFFGTPVVTARDSNGIVACQSWYRDIEDTRNKIVYEGMEVSAYRPNGEPLNAVSVMFANGDGAGINGISLSPSDYIIFKGRIGISTDSSLSTEELPLDNFKMYFSSAELDVSGSSLVICESAESVTSESIRYDPLDGNGTRTEVVRWVEISVSYQLPSNYVQYTSPKFAFDITFTRPYSSWTCFFFDDIQWYLGDKENAPLYPSVDDSSLNDVIDAEDKLMGSAQEGLDVFTDHVQMFTGSYFPNSGILGAIAGASAIVNVFVNKWEWLEVLLNFSLCLGVIMIVFGIVGIISSKASREAHSAANDDRRQRKRKGG